MLRAHFKSVLLALLPIVVFMIFRGILNSIFPVVNFEEWVHLDFIKNIPRLLCLGLSVFVAKRAWPAVGFSIWTGQGFLRASLILVIHLALAYINGLWNAPHLFTTDQAILIAGSSIVVGIFEEYAFRFTLLEALVRAVGAMGGVLWTSIAFMLFHVQAQPLFTLPYLFLFGCQYAILRLMGVSLLWLMVIHAVYDALIIYIDSVRWNSGYFLFELLHAVLTATLFFLFMRSRLQKSVQ